MPNVTHLTVRIGEEPDTIVKQFAGRFAWTLARLVEAGTKGVTPLEYPAPRWSHYVHVLRREGVAIETMEEQYGGSFKGWHGRYVLRSCVTILSCREAA